MEERLAWNNQSWGYWEYPFVPSVSKLKWLEPRHMVNVCRRWGRDKTDDLQYAFFNGVGYESWENIWGIWNGISARDGEATRRMATIERGVARFLTSQDWEPLYPMHRYGVYARLPAIPFPDLRDVYSVVQHCGARLFRGANIRRGH